MEKERENRGFLIFLLLMLTNAAAGQSAFSANNSLIKIREQYGQQAEEKDSLFLLVIEDFCLKTLAIFLSVLFTIFKILDKLFEKIGIDLYEIDPQRQVAKVMQYIKSEDSVESINMSVEEKKIVASFPIENPSPTSMSDLEKVKLSTAETHATTKVEVEKGKTEKVGETGKGVVMVVDNASSTKKVAVGVEWRIIEENGEKFVLWNGEKRDLRWCKKQRSTYSSKRSAKIQYNLKHPSKTKSIETESARIKQLDEAISLLV